MAKKTNSVVFSKGVISQNEEGTFIFTEIGKDYSKDYNLSEMLRQWIDVDNVSILIKADDEVPPILDA